MLVSSWFKMYSTYICCMYMYGWRQIHQTRRGGAGRGGQGGADMSTTGYCMFYDSFSVYLLIPIHLFVNMLFLPFRFVSLRFVMYSTVPPGCLCMHACIKM